MLLNGSHSRRTRRRGGEARKGEEGGGRKDERAIKAALWRSGIRGVLEKVAGSHRREEAEEEERRSLRTYNGPPP
jgi:hypothetical protein